MPAEAQLLERIDSRREELVELTRDLIRFPTVNPHGEAYRPCAEYIGRRLQARGFAVQYVHAAGTPGDTERYPRESALSIVRGQQVWMRNTSVMNDYQEVWHGFDCVTKAWGRHGPALKIALNNISRDIGTEAEALFASWAGNIRDRTYIASISEHDATENLYGRLSMWRAFGSLSIPRVAIVWRLPWFTGAIQALKVMLSPVGYFNDVHVDSQLARIVENVESQGNFLRSLDRRLIINAVFNMLAFAVTSIKHEGFKEEREWRLLYWPDRLSSTDMQESTETIGGVPQRVYKMPIGSEKSELAGIHFTSIFERLIVGPSQFPSAICDAFIEQLKAAGIPDAAKRVVASNIPIRS